MKTIRKKYIRVISSLLCCIILSFTIVTSFPYFHNLDADLNIWNVNELIILEGKHNHKDNPDSPCIDFHKIKIINVGDCLICDVFGNLRFIFSSLSLVFYNGINYPLNFLKYTFLFQSNIYNLSSPRAPPVL